MAVSVSDVATALGRPIPAGVESAQWGMWIEDANLLIGRRLGDVSALDQGVVDYVVREAVVAQVRNPENATQVDVAVDDARMSKRYQSGAGRVTILDEWWDLLTPDGGGSAGAFTISPFGAPDRAGDGVRGWLR